jgi:hydrogenase expression/formation protein HypD
MGRPPAAIAESLDRLNRAARALSRPVAFMEVCGTHTVNAFRCGLHGLMPENVTLLSGPGCPVCVTAQGDIDMLIELALRGEITLCTYGDMMRVTGASGTLEQARTRGADVRVVYSSMDAVKLAAARPDRQVVFAAVGFETTSPGTAAAVLDAQRLALDNFTVLASHKLVVPAMRALLDGGLVKVHGFLCPGHVSVIIGSEAFRPVVAYGLPCVIAGFDARQIAEALARLAELVRDGQANLENLYSEAVSAEGNRVALEMIARVFQPADVRWRGLGVIAASGLVLRREYDRFNAQVRCQLRAPDSPEPAGCRCGEVITGRCRPSDCPLFARDCTPTHPIGPCMVSSEGPCQAWFKYRRAAVAPADRAPQAPG